MRAHAAGLFGTLALIWLAPASAEPPRQEAFEFHRSLALGIAEHDLGHGTEVTGWRLNHSWYLGHEDGDEGDALSLIWHGERKQVSISTEGVRITRRF